MQKFRAAVIGITLAVMFFIPMGLIEKEESGVFENAEKETPVEEDFEAQLLKEENEEFFRIFDMETEEILNVGYSDYVKGAIASEMGADFEFEALVAQGVAAFTCGLYQKESKSDGDYDFSAAPGKKLGYLTEEKAKEIYGGAFEEKWKIISDAAEKAMRYVLIYDGEPALSVYHAVSAGMTESAENVWNGALPYLVSVESSGDVFYEWYESEVSVSKDEALKKLNSYGADLNGKHPEEWFEGAELSDAGYVKSIKIGAATFSGEKLRNLFGLRSAAFDAEYKNGEFIFTVRGYGHGVGMSQVGANYMAKNGADFKEILAHYYPGTKLLEYNEIYK